MKEPSNEQPNESTLTPKFREIAQELGASVMTGVGGSTGEQGSVRVDTGGEHNDDILIDRDDFATARRDPGLKKHIQEALEYRREQVAKEIPIEHGFNYELNNGTIGTSLKFEESEHLHIRANHDDPDHYAVSWSVPEAPAQKHYIWLAACLGGNQETDTATAWFDVEGESETKTLNNGSLTSDEVSALFEQEQPITAFGFTCTNGDSFEWHDSSHPDNKQSSARIIASVDRSKKTALAHAIVRSGTSEVVQHAHRALDRIDNVARFYGK